MNTFYYSRLQLFLLFVVNVALLCFCIMAAYFCPSYIAFISFITVISLISLSASLYVLLFPQKLAQLDNEGIIIDHNAKLKWEDIASVNKIVVSGLLRRKIIRFKTKNETEYSLTFMQKICKNSPYGAFSIPLYAMTKNDAAEIERQIDSYMAIL